MVKLQKTTWIILALAVLLTASVVYIGMNTYNNYRTQQQLNVYRQGVNDASQQLTEYIYQNAVQCQGITASYNNQTVTLYSAACFNQAIFAQASACKPLPITYNNQTINIIAQECVSKR